MIQDLLKMIETVSPDDTEKLDEIDARASVYITKAVTNWQNSLGRAPKYTRSRDALKSIRPEGWLFGMDEQMSIRGGRWVCEMFLRKKGEKKQISSPDEPLHRRLPTEELAELHAILQAIEFERAK